MKKLIVILLFTFPSLVPLVVVAQSSPPVSVVHDETFGYCNSGGTRVVCNGSSGQPWRGQFPQDSHCATGPVLNSGPFSGSATKMCMDRNQISFYTITYDANNLITSVTHQTAFDQDTGDFVDNTLGGPTTSVTAPGGTGVESDIQFDPNIGTNGAFVFVMEGWLVTPTPPSGQTQLFMGVSQTPDAISTAWNTKLMFDVAANDVTGDVAGHLLIDKNGLLVSAANIPFDTTNFPSIIWGWGTTSRATLNSVSFAGVNNLPTWDIKFGRGTGTTGQQPSDALLPMMDNNPSKGSSDPAIFVANCDFAEPGGGCTATNAQNGTRTINFTLNEVTWTSATTATFAKVYLASTISFNPAGKNVCSVSGSPSPTKGGPGDLFTLNGQRINIGNTSRNGIGVETSAKAVYLGQSTGCVSATTPNSFVPVKIDVTNPASPVITQYATIGGGAAGNPDMTLVTTTHDVAGNVIWSYNASSPTQAMSPAVSYLPAGGSTLSGPFFLNTVLTTDGTISALNGTVTHTFTKPLDFILISVAGLPVGTFTFQDQSGNAINCNLAGTSPYTVANHVTNPGLNPSSWGCVVTGLTGVKVKATAYTSGTATITTYEGYASTRFAAATCPSSSNGSISGSNNGSFQDPTNPNIIWFDASEGRRNDIPRCSWYTQGVAFQPHFPLNTFTISPTPTSTVAQGGTLSFTKGTITYTDSLTDNTCAGMVHNWVSSNPVAATINASTGVLTGVTSGQSTNVTFVCNGVANATPTAVTVNAGGPTLVSIALTPSTEQLVPQNAVVSFSATCTYSSGPPDSCPGATGWASSSPTCATISNAGVVNAGAALQQVCNTNITLTIGSVVSPATIVRVNSYPATTIF
jgi:hypothetical protein